jgi:hypothetical protein
MQTITITVKDASQAINLLATNFMESKTIDSELLSVATRGITSNVTADLRDYVLGMPADFGLKFMIDFAEAIKEQTQKELSYAITTILAGFYYEAHEPQKSRELLKDALSINPTYSLAILYSRVFGSGWTPESLNEMRSDLHPKVVRSIREQAEVEL